MIGNELEVDYLVSFFWSWLSLSLLIFIILGICLSALDLPDQINNLFVIVLVECFSWVSLFAPKRLHYCI